MVCRAHSPLSAHISHEVNQAASVTHSAEETPAALSSKLMGVTNPEEREQAWDRCFSGLKSPDRTPTPDNAAQIWKGNLTRHKSSDSHEGVGVGEELCNCSDGVGIPARCCPHALALPPRHPWLCCSASVSLLCQSPDQAPTQGLAQQEREGVFLCLL